MNRPHFVLRLFIASLILGLDGAQRDLRHAVEARADVEAALAAALFLAVALAVAIAGAGLGQLLLGRTGALFFGIAAAAGGVHVALDAERIYLRALKALPGAFPEQSKRPL